MQCPKCKGENPQDALFCCSCGSKLPQLQASAERVKVRISAAAVASFVCSLIAFACFVPGLIAATDPTVLNPRSDLVNDVACVSILAGGLGFVLAIAAFSSIAQSGGRLAGRGFATLGAVIPPILILVLFWHNIGRWGPRTSRRMVCGTNLSGIGKAMLIYSNDYDDKLPRTGGVNSTYAQGGVGTVSSCFYLLVKYAEVTPKSFLCLSDSGAKPFDPTKYGARDRDLALLWDFGPEPWKHCSYSYHMPFGPYALTTSCERGMAVAADRNPWIDSPFVNYRKDFRKFDPDGKRKALQAGNTISHHGDGQNVLFLDSPVSFEKGSFCGVNDDNIYTYWDGDDTRLGARPVPGSQPQDRKDSLLVHDPPVPKTK